ncbi:MAG TPA: DUF2064 domain-containing protein [Thermoanaerobaculia bacterium]|nr:DUF2064 domain-containing protein [Thermoanaerobaculia bacterium]
MAVVLASDLAKDMAGEPLLRGVSFKLERRDRMTLSGRNGSGKTTLLRMLSGETGIDGGELVFAKDVRVSLHDQRPPRDRDLTLRDYVLSGCKELLALEDELARLEAAMADAFAGGAAPLVVVGADTPGLAAAHLERALALLAARPDAVVVGPSPDGGLYLLAASRPIPGLAAVRWCGAEALASLLATLRASGRPVELLPPLADLDNPADLKSWLGKERPPDSRTLALWRSLLARALAALALPPRPRSVERPADVPLGPLATRAPPALLLT